MKSQHEICRSMSKTVSDSADCVLLQCIRKHLSKSEVTPDTADENSCNNLKKNHTGCCIRQFLGERSFQASSNSSDIMMFLKAMVVLLSSDASTASKSILNCLVPSNADATLFVKERESIADRKLPLISFSGVDVPGSETSLYVCNYGSWEQLRSLVQLVSVDYYAVFGDAHSSLKHESNQTSFMWHLKPYSIRNKHDAGKGKGHIW
ncbi:Ribosomal RNA large subunit methyltransferase K/L [Frankliniella fusca]|uniref:Ribosomal RNA large subunit methyltransferase K/L n=1 Tax=Frankliniella fusca TaxID=407009 RepID=A0AAE1LIK2_9NEOP|nr:Ribosomal RNA large subunit methyltransferase K/L [Frankliniella fusca]